MRVLVSSGISGIVIVRSYRFGDTPIRHGKFGIEFGGMLKRTCCFVVIEGIDESQPLIEKLLCLRVLRRNRVMQISQTSYQHDGSGLSMRRMILALSCQARQKAEEKPRQNFHLVNPPEFDL